MTEWVSERLSEVHDLSQFDSGQESLDLWLRDHAAHADRMNTARTFVFHEGDHQVIGYYSLTMGRVQEEELPSTVARGGPRIVPVVLLARLAVVERAQGQGMGAELLFDALARTSAANSLAAARAIVVDAIDERAALFYEHFGFIRVASVVQFPIRLAIKMTSVERNLGV
jgi:predicted GNAT family N-acyltransferase